MRRNKITKFSTMMGLAVLALLVHGPLKAENLNAKEPIVELSHSDAQAIFTMGMLTVEKLLYDEALEIFDHLYLKTSSSRVLLEKARVLYLMGRYGESKELFYSLYFEHDLPQAVRETVRRFILATKDRTTSFDFSFGTSTDSNPMDVTFHDSVTVFGQELEFDKPPENQTTTGLWVNTFVNVPVRSFGAVYSNLKVFDAPGSFFDYTSLGVGGRYLDPIPYPSNIELYAEKKWTNDETDSTDLSLTFNVLPHATQQWKLSGTYGKNRLLERQNFDAFYTNLSFTKYFTAGGKTPFEIQVGISDVKREDDFNSNQAKYMRAKFSGVVKKFIPSYQLSYRKVSHEGEDYFFKKTRDDKNLQHKFSVDLTRFFKSRYTPEFSVVIEENQSNIDYFDYKKIMLQVSLTSL